MDTLSEYLDVFYSGGLRESAEGVFCALADSPGDGTPWPPSTEAAIRRQARGGGGERAFYVSIMSAFPDAEGRYRNRREQFASLHCIPLDDLGGKVSRTTVLPPTALIETSEGNYQAHYILREPIDDVDLAEQVIRAVFGSELTDQGGKLVNKFVRLPLGVNGKDRGDGRSLFPVRLVEWNPEALYTWQELLEAWGLELAAPRRTRTQARPSLAIHDPVVDWLAEHKLLTGGGAAGWLEVTCPWAHAHTTPGGDAAYSPLGSGELPEWRGFKCHHGHCAHRKAEDFLAWVAEQRGPEVPAHDPLSVAVQRYALVTQGALVVDLLASATSPYATQMLSDWRAAHMMRLPAAPGQRGAPLSLAEGWIRSPRTRRFVGQIYDPRQGREIRLPNGEWVLNTYTPPDWPEVTGVPLWFIDHVKAILPHNGEAETFLDWLAFKFQNPGKRSWGVVMVAHEVFGIGRSMLGRALDLLLPRQVRTITVDELLGEGSQAQFNDWEYGSLFVLVNEVKETLFSVRQDSQHYEQAKRKADPMPIMTRIRPKFGRIFEAEVFHNLLFFTNHMDAVRLPTDDRRFAVFTNSLVRRDPEAYAQFLRMLDNPVALAELYWWLMRRDVSQFDSVTPPMTRGKQRMTEATISEVEEVWRLAMERLPGAAVTLKQVLQAVQAVCSGELEDPALADSAKRFARRKYRGLDQEYVVKLDGKATRCKVLRPAIFGSRQPEPVDLRAELDKNGCANVISINRNRESNDKATPKN